MAKRQKTTRFSIQAFDNAHYRTTEQYTRAVDALFDVATMEISQAAAKGKIDPEKPFSFDDYPKIKGVMQNVTAQLADRLTTTIESGSKNQWLFACKKNDRFIASIMDTSKLSKAQLNKMQDQNLDALKAFQGRKVEGLNLSERVWKYVGQYQEQMESALDAGLGEGRSAQQLAREVKQNLNDPNRLFRRVRDKRGNLVLSKAARAFHPGRGVYRSSVKNAQRLTRSEINMSYRESDWQRWQSLDFIVGFEVVRSNHEPLCDCDICSQLVGRYPKTFKFVGWHPQCMCYAIPILMDEKTFDDNELGDLKAALRGTTYKHKQAANTVPDVPDGFKDWVKDHIEAQRKWASTPYFIRDNFKNGDLSKGLKIVLPTIQKVAIALFKGNTPQEIKDFIIQNIADSCTIEIKARDLDLWNDIVNQLNVRMQQFGLKKFGNIGVPRSKAAEASWDSFGNNFNLNMTAVRNKSAIKKAAAWKKRGVMYSFAYEDSDDYVRALIDHELGHAILNGYAKMADVASLMSKVGVTITVNGKPFNPINDVLGYYASTEEHEFFAEAFSFYMGKNRDKLDDRIKEYFEQLFAKNGFKLEANAGQQIDPVQRELDLLQPQIAAIRQMCAEWGIDSNSLDVAISMRNPNAIVSAINTLKDRVYKSMDELKAYIADATATIKKAKGHDIDAIDVLNDLQGINADKRKWTMEKANIKKRLNDLLDKISATKPQSSTSRQMPDELKAKSTYLNGEDYTFAKDFFDLIDPNKPIRLEILDSDTGSYSSFFGDLVHIAGKKRGKSSPWECKSVIYHEYGHCIDAQRGLWQDAKLIAMRNAQIKMLKKKGEYTLYERKWNHESGGWYYERTKQTMTKVEYIDKKLVALTEKIAGMGDDVFIKRGITKADVIEQIGSTRDTIKSLVVKYGSGHSTSYFRKTRMKETEYLAHAFENAFLGNRVFQKYLPDIYAEMVAYIRALKPIK